MAEKTKTKNKTKKSPYIPTVGRRKTAVARIRLYPKKKGGIEVNGKEAVFYFKDEASKQILEEPLKTCNVLGNYLITVKVEGSGKMGQLGAVVHGISRALVKLDKDKFREPLKKKGFLTRDPRMKERRKPGTGGKARRQKQSPKR
jgi:small subunit ribosomal protein S9